MNENMQQAIQMGIFGSSDPNIQQGYNPYGNIIPFGNGNMQPQQNNFVFQSIPQQQTYYNGYGYQPQPQPMYYVNTQPQQNYYDPYAGIFNNNQNTYQQQNYYNGYGYPNYRPYYSPQAIANYKNQQIELMKIKYRMSGNFFNNGYSEDELDKICNPQNPANIKSPEEIKLEEDYKFIRMVSDIADGKIYNGPSIAELEAQSIINESAKKHELLDSHGMIQFFNDDLWRIQEQDWIEKNCKTNASRDFSNIYNSRSYNELLKFHNSTNNSDIDKLLEDSKYDNNLDDAIIGLDAFNRRHAMDVEMRRRAILEGKVPSFVSSNEVQQKRYEFNKNLLNRVYNKGGRINV